MITSADQTKVKTQGWTWKVLTACLLFPILLIACETENNETSQDSSIFGPPASQSAGTFILSARGGTGSGVGSKGGAGGGLEQTIKAHDGNVGDGSISNLTVSSSTVGESFTIECQVSGGPNVAKFSVVGSASGDIGTAISDQEFMDADQKVRFTITTGTTLWSVGDKFTFPGPPLIQIKGANVRLIKEGSVNTSFTVPVAPGNPGFEPDNLGSNPRTISTDTTIEDFPSLDLFSCSISGPGSTIPGDNGGRATGLWVQPGVTLTLTAIPDCLGINPAGISPELNRSVFFEKDILIEGTVITSAMGLDKQRLSFATKRNLTIQTGGSAANQGGDNGAGNGGNGSAIELTSTSGKVIIQGIVNASGGNGTTDGGNGGDITVTSGLDVFNTGAISADGGMASSGSGGEAGSVSFTSNSSSSICTSEGLFNSGNLSAQGGDGTSGGRNGGNISLEAGVCGVGNLINTAPLSSNGGRATGSDGNGGDAGAISFKADDLLLNSGTLSANGGDGVGSTSIGGNGGAISVTLTSSQPDSIQIAADVSSNGGNGQDRADGGSGAPSITINAGNGNLHLLNFALFDIAGGNGASRGSRGGARHAERLQQLRHRGNVV